MAGIPQYEPQAEPRPLPTPYAEADASPASYGAGLGQGLEEVGEAGSKIAAYFRASAIRTQVTDAYGHAKAAINDLVFDPQNGYAALRGKAAVDGFRPAQTQIDDAIKRAEQTLTTPDAKKLWRFHGATLRAEANASLEHHFTQQSEVYSRASYQGAFAATTASMEGKIANGDLDGAQRDIDALHQVGIDEAKRRYGDGASRDAIAGLVLPKMQEAAYGGMQAAVGTQDPVIARQALDKLGGYLITGHNRDFSKAVSALETRQQVGQSVQEILGGATTSVAIPGGAPVARLDGTKVAAGLAALAPDDPHLPDIQKGVELQQKRLDAVWSANVATIADRVHSAGQDPTTGEFSYASAKINPADKAWLNQHAPGEIDKLKATEAKSARPTSAENLSVLSADMHDEAKWAQSYSKMSPAQFLQLTLDQKQFPGGFTGPDRKAAQAQFNQLRAQGAKLEEPIGRTVKNVIADAFPDDPYQRKAFEAKFFEPLRSAAQTFLDSEKAAGRKVNTDAIEKMLQSKMAKVPSGHWYSADQRQIQIDAASVVNAPPAPPPAAKRPSRTINGVTKFWDGKQWVGE